MTTNNYLKFFYKIQILYIIGRILIESDFNAYITEPELIQKHDQIIQKFPSGKIKMNFGKNLLREKITKL
jgi:hypothetical protein